MTDLLDDLKALITLGAAEDDRSQQRDLGPSEVGHPCMRKLALGLMHEPKVNTFGDPLPSVVGTGAHSRFEIFAHRANARLAAQGQPARWLAEMKVTVRQGLSGTCDLVDLATMTAIDHKLPGQTRMHTYTSKGPSQVYRAQAHLYGRGLRNIGIGIEQVAIAFWPRGGQMRHAHLWTEPYNDALVDEVLDRITATTLLIADLDVGEHPERYQQIPATPVDCWVCPWHNRNPATPTECDGTNVGSPTPQGALAL